MKVEGKHRYVPVQLTFETEIEFHLFWDGIEEMLKQMREGNLKNDPEFKELLIEISNNFTEL